MVILATLYSAAPQWLRSCGALLAFVAVTHAADEPSFASRAEDVFLAARLRFDAEMTNAVLAIELGRAAFDWAEFASTDHRREVIAKQGIAACRKAIRLQPDSGAAHHYLALNLGQLARTRKLSALAMVEEMEHVLLKAIELDPRLEHAGPVRSLGMLYRDAPGWPISIGNRAKARKFLEQAVQLEPDYPENHLVLIEACAKWKDKSALHKQVQTLAELWPEAQKKLSGPPWEDEWSDWTTRWKKIRTPAKIKATP